MIPALIFLIVTRAMTSLASRVQPRLGVHPHSMSIPLNYRVARIHTPVNVLHLQMHLVAPADHHVRGQGWKANTHDTQMSQQSFAVPAIHRMHARRHDKVLAMLGDHLYASRALGLGSNSSEAMWFQKQDLVLALEQQVGPSWEVGKLLGQGQYAQVWELARKNKMESGSWFGGNAKRYAGKVIRKGVGETDANYLHRCRKEAVMQKLAQGEPGSSSKHLVKLERGLLRLQSDLVELPNGDQMIIMELMSGGELFDKVDEFRRDKKVKHIFRQIVAGVKDMHEAGLVHRDLKMQNIFCNEDRASPTCKVGDFGGTTTFPLTPEEQMLRPGSLAYMSPEIYRAQPHLGKEVDVWALGVVLYRMLAGWYPFDHGHHSWQKRREAVEAWVAGPTAHATERLVGVERNAVDLISHMLDKNQSTRYTIQEVAAHPYFAELTDTDSSPGHNWWSRLGVFSSN